MTKKYKLIVWSIWKYFLKLSLLIYTFPKEQAKIMASGPITSWQVDGETMETLKDFIFFGSKSLQMVT